MNNRYLYKAKRMSDGVWISGGSIIQFLDDGIRSFYMPQFNKKCVCTHDDVTDDILGFESCRFYKVDPSTICQCTGKRDNTRTKEFPEGKLIFEHDIVAFLDTYSTESGRTEQECIGEVLWDDEDLCFYVTERLSAESYEVLDDCKVVGNIL